MVVLSIAIVHKITNHYFLHLCKQRRKCSNFLSMRINRYLYVLESQEGKSIIFNAVSRRFLLFPQEKVKDYISVIRHAAEKKVPDSFLSKLVDAQFLIEDETDEFELIRQNRQQSRWEDTYQTMILPTFDCNFSCWYCTQHHKSTMITQEVMDLMVLHITRYILDNNIKSYRILWFGGEPLLEPDAIDYISSRVLAFCVQHGVGFRGQITTNGALLSEEVIVMLQRNRINDYQITLDGNRNHHNQVKRSDDIPSSFDLILNNIKNLLIHNSQATVILRHNYTDKSLQDVSIVDEINKIIPRNLRSRIYIDLKKVWQIRESDIDMHRLHHLLLLFGESGYKLNTIGPLDICYVDRKHFNTLYFDGKVGKCNGRQLKSLRGHLDEEGRAIWSEQLVYPSYDILEKEKKCIECRYLPLCMGGCPRRREDHIKKNEPMECPEEKDLFFQHNVLDLCWRQMINGTHSSH